MAAPLTFEQFKVLRKQGLSPQQIASFESGKAPGGKFATPPVPVDRATQVAGFKEESDKAMATAKSAGNPLKIGLETAKGVGATIANSEVGLANTLVKSFGNQSGSYAANISNLDNSQKLLLDKIRQNKAEGKDTSRLEAAFNANIDAKNISRQGVDEESVIPTNAQALAQIGGTALDVLTVGTYGPATAAMKSGVLASKAPTALKVLSNLGQKAPGLFTKEGLKRVGVGAGIGYASDVTQGLQGTRGEERTGGKAFIPGAGTVIVGGVPAALGLKQSVKNIRDTDLMTKRIAEEWSKPSTTPKASYKKATEIYDNANATGHNIGETLVKNKIRLSDNIEGKNYNTLDTADNIRVDGGRASRDLLRPALKAAEPSVPKTPVNTVIKAAKADIRQDRFLTVETKNTLIKNLQKSEKALGQTYSSGMSLTDLLDEKIVRDFNAKYSPIGDIATNNSARVNKAIADSARTLLKKTAPKDVPVSEFMDELTKQNQVADYLEALHTKPVPVSMLSKLRQTTAKVIGASIGYGAGGGLLGGAGGYHIGGFLEGMLENMPSPLKNYFLNNLKQTNPAAFQKMISFTEQAALDQATRLRLPAPSGIRTQSEAIEILKKLGVNLEKIKPKK